ncbi:hypothetical protein NLJ89_g2129 [Agrocybe chaxingu]|uniref:Uncharacterized protein n=1 Tax=Agrocybe chaxingu TaxID=84603 RepID=A0A9W8K4Z7_9AGAR|nr:hypothetical protein NLJ89_g2129 [Agrocybe chaxingu]
MRKSAEACRAVSAPFATKIAENDVVLPFSVAMSDQQKSTTSLQLLVENSRAALDALESKETSLHDEGFPSTGFTTLRTDFISLLALIYAATTKVALSLKPSSPEHKASLTPLKNLSNNVAALVHSIRLMRRNLAATILKEYEIVARNVIREVLHFSEVLLSPPAASTSNEDYLVGVGKMHELIDLARRSGGLSLNNREAVRKRWLQDRDSLVDGEEEIQEICQSSDSDEPADDDELFDDGWEELGISSKQKLSPVERDRVEKVHSLIKIVVLLHKRVLKDVLEQDLNARNDSTLDNLATLSGRLLEASDDLISSMYGPQQPSNIIAYLDAYSAVLKDVQKTLLLPRGRSLEDQVASLSLSMPSDEKSVKWFTTCFDQIEKATAKISDILTDADRHES